MIYLASPYTSSNEALRIERYNLAVAAVGIFLRRGEFVYSPIVHCHVISETRGLPTDYKFWLDYNNDFIRRCDAMYILTLAGWEGSNGVTAEIAEAKRLKLPIKFFGLQGDYVVLEDYWKP